MKIDIRFTKVKSRKNTNKGFRINPKENYHIIIKYKMRNLNSFDVKRGKFISVDKAHENKV